MNAQTNPNWYSLIQEGGRAAKAIDPNHPIATVEGRGWALALEHVDGFHRSQRRQPEQSRHLGDQFL